ncbi:hypothetical protein NVIE_004040 [Nitrososphaera viennensis EN76]|uniref:Uncharacterized protein n=1 Tax=Nitrososphaera viennensis EN76 TaxID=926571 RepID=A0A060HN02_9ARCH|nr:hypothetical protein NVIE_004040 [Nitrososphaera viennensis EN76]
MLHGEVNGIKYKIPVHGSALERQIMNSPLAADYSARSTMYAIAVKLKSQQ